MEKYDKIMSKYSYYVLLYLYLLYKFQNAILLMYIKKGTSFHKFDTAKAISA